MKKVITYGTYDLLHQGHINLLRRAKALGDYLIVGVTSDSFDRNRGKLNVRNNVLERVEAVRETGIADKIIIEDYVGQKIDDIQAYDVDIFAIGSDWEGKFDYLNEYCQVVYLPRTEGISSTMLREQTQETIRVGIIGAGRIASRFVPEASCVSGVDIVAVFDTDRRQAERLAEQAEAAIVCDNVEALLDKVDAVYIASPHLTHYLYIRQALLAGKHVLCETPMVLRGSEARELCQMASDRQLVLMEANKTAYCPAFNHLMVMVKSGVIGEVVDVEASLTKLWIDQVDLREFDPEQAGGSMFETGSYPLLPILKLLGTDYTEAHFFTRIKNGVDVFTKGVLSYPSAISSFKLGLGAKTEGNLVISGTKGYAYVPAPWWKTDYFELRYEDQNDNKKFFYKWDEAGLRYELREFVSCIVGGRYNSERLMHKESIAMADLMQQYGEGRGIVRI